MKSVLFIYPYQLFAAVNLPDVDQIYVIEEPLLFGNDQQYPMRFHKAKLVLMRAALRRYVEEVLWPTGKPIEYFDIENTTWTGMPVIKAAEAGFQKVVVFDLHDSVLWRRLHQANEEQKSGLEFVRLPTPAFYLQHKDIDQYFSGKQKHKFADFYQWQRERFNILIDPNSYRPVGGKWSFDTENRKKLPADVQLPGIKSFGDNKHVTEAVEYINQHFPANPGQIDSFIWPTSHAEAEAWLDDFLRHRLSQFGPFEDAISSRGVWLYHSLLSSSLNIGLLTPSQVIEKALAYAEKNDVPLASLEGFIRQVLGWREYVRGLYENQHVSMRKSNVFRNYRKLTSAWYDGTTGIKPVDDVIKKVNQHAYAHHIERLMVIGNIMLLSEIHPDEVYKWFMTFFIDAYDWVMVPNVYGMSQFADGGNMTTKPYISASNYILSMSDYEREPWCDIWDGLFWRFVEKHQGYLGKNPRLGGVLVTRLSSMDQSRRRIIGYRAEDFLANFTVE